MSLVLEALKKQEAGSNPEAAVSLALAARARRRHRLWAALFAAAMAANAALVVWVFVLPGAKETPVAAPDPVGAVSRPRSGARADRGLETAPTGVAASGGSRDRGLEAAPIGAAPTGGSRDRGLETAPTGAAASGGSGDRGPETAPTGAAATPQRVRLGELPADVRGRFPGLAFSTHIYADDADLRAVVANGERVTEGERVRGLRVVEITERGVVLAFERYEVEVPIVTDWDSL